MALNNPAGRLAAILERGWDLNGNTLQRHAWATMLECEEGISEADLLAKVALAMHLPAEIRLAVERREDLAEDLYLAGLDTIEDSFSQKLSLRSRWQGFREPIPDTAMTGLRFCDHALTLGQPDVTREELQTLLEEGLKLRKLIADLDPSDLRSLLLAQIDQIVKALVDYPITGADGARLAVDASLGSIVVRNQTEVARAAAADPVARDRIEQIFNWISRVGVSLAVFEQARELAEAVIHALPPAH